MKENHKTKCPLCNGDADLKCGSYPGYVETMVFKIYHCMNCQSAFSIPRIENTKELYEIIYSKKDEIPGYNRYWKYVECIKTQKEPLEYLAEVEEIYWGINEALQQSIMHKSSVNILEIGSGLGYLTYALRKTGYNCVGIDISEKAVNQAKLEFGNHYICTSIKDYAEKEIESFDFIILAEVIEHINEPISFFKSLWKMIKPHGRVIITTPNNSFYPSDIIWTGDYPPVHCWWFNEKSFYYIGKILDADIKLIDFSNYYKFHYSWTDINNIRYNSMLISVLNKSGQVNKCWKQKNSNNFMTPFRKSISRFTILKNIVRKTRILINPSIIIAGQRGPVMCALFEKL
jgi:2-polyprenyl-3-methyl-5-hydroxy-6-metoxy-1,4-benzoquinol methylase